MRAIRKREPSRASTSTRCRYRRPAPDEVLVRIEAASICGTDLHIQRWDQWSSERVQPPLTLGHELCGTVVATGSTVRDVEEGDYVSAESHVTCGVCFHCRTGKAHMCEQTRILGVDRDGGFADYVAVPGVGRLAERPREAPARDRVPAGAVRQRGLRDVDAGSRGPRGRRPRVRPGRALHDRDRARPSAPAACSRPTTCPFRIELARQLGADDVVNVDERRTTCRAWFAEQNEGIGVGVVFEMSGALAGDRGCVRDRAPRRQRRPLRHPGAPGDDRRRRVAHLQEPHRDAR